MNRATLLLIALFFSSLGSMALGKSDNESAVSDKTFLQLEMGGFLRTKGNFEYPAWGFPGVGLYIGHWFDPSFAFRVGANLQLNSSNNDSLPSRQISYRFDGLLNIAQWISKEESLRYGALIGGGYMVDYANRYSSQTFSLSIGLWLTQRITPRLALGLQMEQTFNILHEERINYSSLNVSLIYHIGKGKSREKRGNRLIEKPRLTTEKRLGKENFEEGIAQYYSPSEKERQCILLFRKGVTSLDESMKETIAQWIEERKNHPGEGYRIISVAADLPKASEEYAKELAKTRAALLKEALIKGGVSTSSISIINLGKRQLFNEEERNRALWIEIIR